MERNFNFDQFLEKAYKNQIKSSDFILKFGDKDLPVTLQNPSNVSFGRIYNINYEVYYQTFCDKGFQNKPIDQKAFSETLKQVKDKKRLAELKENPPSDLAAQKAQSRAMSDTILEICINNLHLQKTGEKLFKNERQIEMGTAMIEGDINAFKKIIEEWTKLNTPDVKEKEDIGKTAKNS